MRTNDACNLAVIALVGMATIVGCAKEPPAPDSFLGKWQTNADGHQLTIEFKSDGSFDGKLADEKKSFATERSMQLVLLANSKKWEFIGRDLTFDLGGSMEVLSVTDDTLTLLVGKYEFLFQRADTNAAPATGP